MCKLSFFLFDVLIGIAVKQKKELHIERRWAFSLTQNTNKALLAFLTSILASRFYVLQYQYFILTNTVLIYFSFYNTTGD